MSAEFIRWTLFRDVMGFCMSQQSVTALFNKDIEISFPHRDYWIYQFVRNVRRSGRGFLLHILLLPRSSMRKRNRTWNLSETYKLSQIWKQSQGTSIDSCSVFKCFWCKCNLKFYTDCRTVFCQTASSFRRCGCLIVQNNSVFNLWNYFLTMNIFFCFFFFHCHFNSIESSKAY